MIPKARTFNGKTSTVASNPEPASILPMKKNVGSSERLTAATKKFRIMLTVNPTNKEKMSSFSRCFLSVESMAFDLLLLRERLHDYGNALPAADARGREAVLLLTPAKLVQQRDHQACACRAQRMAERDSTAVHVGLVAVEAEFLLDGEILPGEGLVHFDQIDVVEFQSGALKRFARRGHRA